MPNAFWDEDDELAAEVAAQFTTLKHANLIDDLPAVVGIVSIIMNDDGSRDARISPALAALTRIASTVTAGESAR